MSPGGLNLVPRQRDRLELRHIGPIRRADVDFGDLTVLVGPQASGKSVLVQTLALLIDAPSIAKTLKRQGYAWDGDPTAFFQLFYGEGFGAICGHAKSSVRWRGDATDLETLADVTPGASQWVFTIPAQRVLTFNQGWPRSFMDFQSGDPFVVRDFSEGLRRMLEGMGKGAPVLFPRSGKLKAGIRESIDDAVFHGAQLELGRLGQRKRVVLKAGGQELPSLSWSAGQREFTPLLLGLYRLMPAARGPRASGVEWVVIEEPEMGLHPRAISAFMLAVLDLLWRGYKVVLSTHSPHVLDLVWGIRTLQELEAEPDELLRLFGARPTDPLRRMAKSVGEEKTLQTYYFRLDEHGAAVQDISSLDPGDDDTEVAGWGGLTEFSGRVADVVADCVQRAGQ